jgi:RNA polymerase sigma-70 factor (ECF subfamily)
MHGSTDTRGLGAASNAVEFELFFEAERRGLFRALYVMTGSVHEAEELAQDAFLKVWERWERVAVMEEPGGYLYRTAMNLSRSRFRRLLRAARTPFSSEQSVDPYAAADARDVVVRAIAKLTLRQRQALVLTDLLDRGTEETAALLHVAPSTVRSLVSEARRSMKTAVEVNDD